MSVVTPFGEMTLGNREQLARFLDAHNRRHQAYVKLTGLKGGMLDGPVDGDWMFRHAARHVALARNAHVKLWSPDTKALLLSGIWKTEQQLLDWNDLHSRLHLLLDKVLKVRG